MRMIWPVSVGGWLWPNITIHTDGMHVVLAAKSSQPTRTELLSYTTDLVWSIPAAVFEAGIDHFVRRVLERLDGCSHRRYGSAYDMEGIECRAE